MRGPSSRRLPEKCLRIKFAAGSPQVRLTLLLLGLLLSACGPIPASPALLAPGTPVPSAGDAASLPSEAACEKSAQVFWGNGRVHDRDWPALVQLAESIDPSFRN